MIEKERLYRGIAYDKLKAGRHKYNLEKDIDED